MPVINGVDTQLANRLIPQDGLFVEVAERFAAFISDMQMRMPPNLFTQRIPYGTYDRQLGFEPKTNRFRGSLTPQQGLFGWDKVQPSAKPAGDNPGFDMCAWTPRTYTWSWDQITMGGFRTSFKSPVVCVNEIASTTRIREQLTYIIKAGANYVDADKENFAREMYIKQAVDSGKASVLCEGGIDYISNPAYRFNYNPFVKLTGYTAEDVTYLTFDADLLNRISTINPDILAFSRQYLEDMAPEGAIGTKAGRMVFGLSLDVFDIEKMVKADADRREDMRYYAPGELIKGFNMGFADIEGWAISHDPRQPRFAVHSITSDADAVKYPSGYKATLRRVSPRKLGSAGTIGRIPTTNEEYIMAEYGFATVFLNNVMTILVPAVVTSLGSGTQFGPAPSFNGDWRWLNILDPVTNPVGENGYFFARCEYWARPEEMAEIVTVFLYKRCTAAARTTCAIDSDPSVGTGDILLAKAAVTADRPDTKTLVVTLAKKLAGSAGAKVVVTDADGTAVNAWIADGSKAPTYKLVAGADTFSTYDKYTVAAKVKLG